MDKTDKPLLDLLSGKTVKQRPVWLMRQAGRYLPEYQEIRHRAGSFLNLCLTPELATEVTLQPVRRFGVDAAILFADILLVPYALGQKLEFHDKKGPNLEPVIDGKELTKLVWNSEKLAPVFETLSRLKKETPKHVTRLGFSGGLWTLACYMIDGESLRGFPATLAAVKNQPGFIHGIMDILHYASLDYLCRQIDAGAEVIQIFDSWAGLLRGDDFFRWVVVPTQRLVIALKDIKPSVPIIGFPRGATPEDYDVYARQTGVDALSLDSSITLDFACERLKPIKLLQGNLSPSLLLEGGGKMKESVNKILSKLGPDHIMNLGHGVLPQTPPEHITAFVDYVHTWEG